MPGVIRVRIERDMRRCKRQHQEERTVPVFLDVAEAALEKAVGELVHRRVFTREFDAGLFRVEAQRLHVVAVGQPEKYVEAVLRWRPEWRDMAKMPFADERCCVVRLQRLGDGDLGKRQAVRVRLPDHVFRKAGADRIAARQQAGARWRANTGRRVKGGKARAFRRHAIKVRRTNGARAI